MLYFYPFTVFGEKILYLCFQCSKVRHTWKQGSTNCTEVSKVGFILFQVLLNVIFYLFAVSDSSDNIFPVFCPNKMQFSVN